MDTTFYRNPFALRASEKIATDDTFVRLFSPDSLKGIESYFQGVWSMETSCLFSSTHQEAERRLC